MPSLPVVSVRTIIIIPVMVLVGVSVAAPVTIMVVVVMVVHTASARKQGNQQGEFDDLGKHGLYLSLQREPIALTAI